MERMLRTLISTYTDDKFQSLHGGGGDRDEDQTTNIIIKVVCLFVIIGITLLFGFFPLFCKQCKNSVKILGIANAFSGGIFIGIAIFHLLPEVN